MGGLVPAHPMGHGGTPRVRAGEGGNGMVSMRRPYLLARACVVMGDERTRAVVGRGLIAAGREMESVAQPRRGYRLEARFQELEEGSRSRAARGQMEMEMEL